MVSCKYVIMMQSDGKKSRLSGRIAKIVIAIIWIVVNIIIFVIAPIFIVGILVDFGVPLDTAIVGWIYVLGGLVLGLAAVMALFNYGSKKRALAALGYTGLVISFLLVVLYTTSGETFAIIEVALGDITLSVDVNFFSNLLILSVIIYGIIYSIELVSVLLKIQERFKHIYNVLKIGGAIGICLFLVTASFFMIVMFSATQIGGAVEDPPEYRYNIHDPFNLTDDTVDMTYNFTIDNGGFLPIHQISFRLDLIVNDSTSLLLTPGMHIGSAQKTIPTLEPGMVYPSNLTIAMDATYTPSFILSDTSFLILIFVTTTVTNLLPVTINISTYSFFSPWMLI